MTDQLNSIPMIDGDPLAEADAAEPRVFELYGQLMVTAYYVYFAGKGERPVPFDPAKHPGDKKTTMIELHLLSIAQQPQRFENKMSCAVFADDWTKITKPSINALGYEARTISGRWVKLAKVPGRNKKKDKPGEFYTCFKILQVFDTEEECVAAYCGEHPDSAPASTEQPAQETEAFNWDSIAPTWGANNAAPAPATPSSPAPASPAAPAAPIQNNDGRDAALAFAKVKIMQVAKENNEFQHMREVMAAFIAANPTINKHFTIDSKEIIDWLMVYAAPF